MPGPGGGVISTNFAWPNHSGIGHDLDKLADAKGAPWVEVDGFTETYSGDHLQVTRYYRCPWGARPLFYAYMLGYSLAKQSVVLGGNGVPAGNDFFLSRVIPAQDPERPFLYVTDVKLQKGEGAWVDNLDVFARDPDGTIILDNGGQPIHIPAIRYQDQSDGGDGYALLAVTYSDLDYDVRSDSGLNDYLAGLGNPNVAKELGRWVSRKYTYQSHNLPLANLQVVFADNPDEVIPEAGPGLILSGQDVVYEWHQVPDFPEEQVAQCVGHVNQAPFDGLSGYPAFPTGTLLCMAPAKQRYRTKTGRVAWEIKYHLLFKNNGTAANPAGWNYFPDASGRFRQAMYKNSGSPIFPSADFNLLFTVPEPQRYQ
jgi:hypothetical protein